MINIENKCHIKLSKADLEDILKTYFHNSHGIDLTKIDIVVGGVANGERGEYTGQDVKEVICEGKKHEEPI